MLACLIAIFLPFFPHLLAWRGDYNGKGFLVKLSPGASKVKFEDFHVYLKLFLSTIVFPTKGSYAEQSVQEHKKRGI